MKISIQKMILILIILILLQSCAGETDPIQSEVKINTPTPSDPPELEVQLFSNANHVSAFSFDGEITLWSAGYGGVTRWDLRDNSYERLTPDKGMPALEAIDVSTDRDGITWVLWGWQKGLSKYAEGQWEHFTDILANQMLLLPSGQLWVVTGEDLRYFENGQWFMQNPIDIFGEEYGAVLTVGPDGNLFALTNRALMIFDDGSWEEIKALDGMVQSNNKIHFSQKNHIFFTQDGVLLVETMQGVSIFSQEEWNILPDFRFSDISAIVYDNERSGYWIAANIRQQFFMLEDYKSYSGDPAGGVFFLDRNLDVKHYDTLLKIDEDIYLGRSVNDLYRDREGNLWIATNSGVGLFNPELDLFDAIISSEDENSIIRNLPSSGAGFRVPPSPINRIVNQFFENPWGIIISEEQTGLNIYDTYSMESASLNIGLLCIGDLETAFGGIREGLFKDVTTCKRDGAFSASQILPDGRLAMANNRHGVLFLEETQYGLLRTDDEIPYSIYSMDTDKNGTLWLATDEGIISFNGDQFSSHTVDPKAYLHITVDPEDRVWASYSWGITQISNESYIKWEPESDSGSRIAYFGPDDLLFGDDWVWGVNNYGVLRLPKGDLTEDITLDQIDLKKSGVINRRGLDSIGADQAGNIWVSSDLGGTAFFDGNEWQSYSVEDNDEIALEHITKAPDGTLWAFSEGSGLVMLNNMNWSPIADQPQFDELRENYQVNDIVFEENGITWVATNDGLLRYGEKGWHLYTTKNSDLPYEYIKSIALEENGTIWVSSGDGHGLVHINQK